MGWIIDSIADWFKGILIDGIMANLGGLFNDVNNQVADVAAQVGTSPSAWNAGVFSLIRTLSETVILPIAGIILTFVMCYELIGYIIDKNNLHDIDTFIFFKWIFKTFVAVMILSNTFNIVMGVFDVSHSVVQSAAGIIGTNTGVNQNMMAALHAQLQSMGTGELLGLWFQSGLVKITVLALNIVIFVIAYGRMIEIYLLTSMAPIPFATMANREIGSMGQNYFKTLLAVAFQGFLIIVCVAIYAVLVQSIVTSGDIFGAIWRVMGYTVLLCFTLFKTGSLSKSIFGAH